MNNIAKVVLYELKINFRRGGYLFMSFGIPVLVIVFMFGYQLLQGDSSDEPSESGAFDFEGIQKAGYVDLSGQFSRVEGDLADFLFRFSDETMAGEALESGEVDVYYVIAEDYLETGQVTLHTLEFSLNRINSSPIEELAITTFVGDVDPGLLQRLRQPALIKMSNLNAEPAAAERDEDIDQWTLYIFSIIFLVGIFTTNGYLMQSVIQEKENRVIEILLSSIRPVQILAGKTLALGLLGIAQIVIWVISVIVVILLAQNLSAFSNTFLASVILPSVNQVPIMALYFLLGYLFFAAVYGGIGSLSNSMREGPQYAVVFTIPAALPFYFFSLFASNPDAPLPVALSLIPVTSPLSMMMRLSIASVPLWQIVISLGLLAGSVLGMMWLSGRLFRVQTLLSGQMPKLRDIPMLVRSE